MNSENKRDSLHHAHGALSALNSYTESTSHHDDKTAAMISNCRKAILKEIELHSPSISNCNDGQKSPLSFSSSSSAAATTNTKHVSADGSKERSVGKFVEPTVSWDSIVGMDNIKSDLQLMLDQPIKTPQFYNNNFRPARNVILWGPPGTGKTVLAEACAKMLNAKFMSVKASDFIDKYVGSSERNVAALFADAASQKGRCVVFFDEFDSFSRKREGSTTEHGMQLTNELLRLMDPDTVAANVYIFAATNNITMIDDAICRRFQQKFFVGLPSKQDRGRLLMHFLSLDDTELPIEKLEQAANITKFYSPSDLKNVVALARDIMLKNVCVATHFRKLDDGSGKYIPCDPAHLSAEPVEQIDTRLILKPTIKLRHIVEATKKIQATCTPALREQYLSILDKR